MGSRNFPTNTIVGGGGEGGAWVKGSRFSVCVQVMQIGTNNTGFTKGKGVLLTTTFGRIFFLQGRLSHSLFGTELHLRKFGGFGRQISNGRVLARIAPKR